MDLADFGSFYIGGRRVEVAGEDTRTIWFTPDVSFDYDPNGMFHIEQAWVQYFVPSTLQCEQPLLLVHGGGLTGVTWDSTPDGRHGWLQHFVSMGHATHVIDSVERGRAGFNAVIGHGWSDEPIVRSEREAWSLFRIGRPEDFDQRIPLPDCQFPVDALEAFTMQSVPRWTSTTGAACDALEAALEKIFERAGRANVICHSQGGGLTNTVAARRPDLFNAIVAVEASGFPEDLPEAAADIRWLSILGDHMDADATSAFLRAGAQRHHDRLVVAGAKSEIVSTVDFAERGNTHLMMMDRNNLDIARFIDRWLTN